MREIQQEDSMSAALDMANSLLRNMADAQSQHVPVIRHKVGEETGRRLQQAGCSCGWRSGIWFGSAEFVTQSYARHVVAVSEGSQVPWMVAPAVPA